MIHPGKSPVNRLLRFLPFFFCFPVNVGEKYALFPGTGNALFWEPAPRYCLRQARVSVVNLQN